MHRSAISFCVFALVSTSAPLAAADLRGMKLLDDDAGTRAVLEIQDAGDYKLFSLQNPDRVVLDLGQARLGDGFRMPGPNGAVANIRTGQPVPGTLRIVFDLGGAVVPHSRIERVGGISRLIVELSSHSIALGSPTLAGRPLATPAESLATGNTAVPAPPSASDVPANVDAISPPLRQAAGQLASQSVAPRPTLPLRPAATATTRIPVRSPAAPPVTSPWPQSAAQLTLAVEPPTSYHPRPHSRSIRDVIGPGQRKLVVAIDAGHGGKDPGAHGPSGVREKSVTLAVARELASQINADAGMRAVLIRDSDRFVPLKERYMKARAAQADLFISIHADASPNDTASGASVFVLSTRGASSQAARWLANQENAADLVGGVSLDEKDHNLAAVLLDLSQSATMRASDDIANQVLGALKSVGKAHKQAIERANFVVLRSPDVPSMLIETGFITNPSEEQRLNDSVYRSRLASAISDGVRKYFTDQPPAGSWYARRDTDTTRVDEDGNAPLVASSPK
ncbi:MAG: N-acetylmuramoyl-L-alanine amidase [Arenimonas sp.]